MQDVRNHARIYSPPKSAMQSGRGRQGGWVLEYEPAEQKRLDPLTGWFGSRDTQAQIRLHFDTREQAVAYAEAHGIPFLVEAERPDRAPMRPKAYADNFRWNRPDSWTH